MYIFLISLRVFLTRHSLKTFYISVIQIMQYNINNLKRSSRNMFGSFEIMKLKYFISSHLEKIVKYEYHVQFNFIMNSYESYIAIKICIIPSIYNVIPVIFGT